MKLDQREPEDTQVLLADLDLLATVVNMERKASLDTLVQEVLLGLTGLLELQDNRDTEATQVSPGNRDT